MQTSAKILPWRSADLLVVFIYELPAVTRRNFRSARDKRPSKCAPGARTGDPVPAPAPTKVGGGGPALDEDAASADKVLEIPQDGVRQNGTTVACDGAAADADDSDDDSQAINAPSPGAPPQVFDDDTASAGTPDSDWGSVDDYQNQQLNAVPYAVYPYVVAVPGTMNRSPQVGWSAYAPMSSPLTQAATPPLNQGPGTQIRPRCRRSRVRPAVRW